MRGFILRLWHSKRAASAAEFALVLPLMLILLLGMIDVGRFMWELNRAEKATQVGARFAVVTDPVSPGLVNADFASGTLAAGELIPSEALDELKCDSSACTCSGSGACPVTDTSVNTTAFDAIVERMNLIDPRITDENVEVVYRGSGFGFAGDAGGAPGGGGAGGATETMEISPLVTVRLRDVSFTPVTGFLLFSMDLPPLSATLPAEDAAGTYSN